MQLLINNSIPFKYYTPMAAHNLRIRELLWVSGHIGFSMKKDEEGVCQAQRREVVALTVKKGGLSVLIQDRPMQLAQGRGVLIHPNCGGCSFLATEDFEGIALALEGTLVEQVLGENFRKRRIFCSNILPEVLGMVRLLENEPGREYDYSVAAYRFLLQLDDAAKIYREETGYPLLVQAAIGVLEEEFAYLDGIAEVAERLGVTESHLIRVFSSSVGIPPGKYLKRCRIEHAKSLLVQPEMTVALAASMAGFSSADYFSKSFRRETGMSPGEFIRSHTGEKKSSKKSRTLINEAYL